MELARNSICKERNLQGIDFARNADAGNYTTFQLLSAASYCADNTLETLSQQATDTDSDTNSDSQTTDDNSELSANNSADDKCVVCLSRERDNIALVPCGHASICRPCADILNCYATPAVQSRPVTVAPSLNNIHTHFWFFFAFYFRAVRDRQTDGRTDEQTDGRARPAMRPIKTVA